MAAAVSIARLHLGARFVLAGVIRLVDVRGSRDTVLGFGMPERLAGPAGTDVPVVELETTAGSLLPRATAIAGAVVRLGLCPRLVRRSLSRSLAGVGPREKGLP